VSRVYEQLVVLSLLAGSTSLVTIAGNVIVILSFIIERSIRQPTNYFIASLAVSDLLIGSSAPLHRAIGRYVNDRISRHRSII